jgi:cobalt/nickel transport system ATP-binding protein
MSTLFEIGDLHFRYQGLEALRGLTLDIAAGERLVLLGANGSGKSTLLRLLDALCFPSAGTLRFDGQALTEEALSEDAANFAFRRRVALLFQNPEAQLFNPTVFDEVAFAPLQLGWPAEKIIAAVDETLAMLDISHLKERPPYRLSGGEKKRVALASVLVFDPEVLLLDEPTAALDPRTQSHFVDLIQSWRGSGRTVITATHQLEIVAELADRVAVLRQGQLLATGTPQEILANNHLLLEANLVHSHKHQHDGVEHSHPHFHGHNHTHE